MSDNPSTQNNLDFATVDFEITGTETDSACEIGVCVVKDGVIDTIMSYGTLILPVGNRPIKGTHDNRITSSMIRENGFEWRLAHMEMLASILDLPIFYHGGKDKAIYEAMCKSTGIPPNDSLEWINSTPLAKSETHGKGELTEVCKYFGITIQNPHRAEDDAKANAEYLLKIAELNSWGIHELKTDANSKDWIYSLFN